MTPATTTTSAVLSVEEALNNSISLIQSYTERNPYDKDPQNPWRNPQTMLDDLNHARNQVMVAWRNLEEILHPHDVGATEKIGAAAATHDVRALYMDMITDAFADVLEGLRQSTDPKELDVDILVDCLQSGLDLLTAEERGLFYALEDDDDEDSEDELMEDESTFEDKTSDLVACQ